MVYLEVGYSHCCDHSKHNKEHASNDWVWDGDKNCPKFSKDPQNDHQNSGHLENQSAANLQQNVMMVVLMVVLQGKMPNQS